MASQTLGYGRASRLLPNLRNRLGWLRTLASGPASTLGLILVSLYVLAGLLSFLPILGDPYHIATPNQFAGPSAAHPMGTDEFGRDQLVRVILGVRYSLEIIVPSCGLALIVGTALGLVAGYFGTVWDNAIMRVVDVFFAFPPVLLALVLVAALGRGIPQLVLGIGIVYTPIFVRTVRGPVLELREREYVKAAQVTGASSLRIIFKHILPGVLAVIVIQMTLTLSWALLIETSLSFLGLGLQPPLPDLGTMLNDGSQFMTLAPWLGFFPGVVIALAVLGLNLLGDALRDALDPNVRRTQSPEIR